MLKPLNESKAAALDETTLTDDQLRTAIIKAYEHNKHARSVGSCNAAYMGSMATARLLYLLGAPTRTGLNKAIRDATRAQLLIGCCYCREHGYLQKYPKPKFSSPEELLEMMDDWLNTSSHYFDGRWPFFSKDLGTVIVEYDCTEESAVAILFAIYADDILNPDLTHDALSCH